MEVNTGVGMIYYLIAFILGLLAFVELFIKKFNAKIVFVICVVSLIVFAGSREIGFDYAEYANIFYYASFGKFWLIGIEPGYGFLCYILTPLGFNGFLFVVALISVSMNARFIARYSPLIFSSLLIYYTTNFIVKEMGQIRQGLVMAISLFAFVDAVRQKKLAFTIKIVIALSLHFSAFILIPVYYLCNKRYSNRFILVSILACLPFLFIDIKFIISTVVMLLPLSVAQEKVSSIFLSDLSGQRLGINSSLILRFIILFLMMKFRKQLTTQTPIFEALISLYFFGTVLYMCFNSIAEFAQRTSVFFRLYEMIIIPCLVMLFKRTIEKGVIIFFIFVNSLFTMLKLLEPPVSRDEYIPYKSTLM